MAAQAFLGSEIALISKSDVRYTGILREVDIPNSRVCLQFCRSHGTEGRRGNMAEELAPSPQIYDYVVFRASDIKDLYVLRTPTAAMQQQDPAIVNAYMNKNERPGVPQQPPPMPSGGMGYIPSPGAPPPSSNPPLPGYAHKQQEGAYGTPPALQQGPPTTVTKTPPKAEPSTAPAKPADAPAKQEAKNNTPVSFPGVDPSLQATKNKDVPSSTTTTFTKDEEVRKDRQEQDARPRRGGRQGGQYNGEGERGGERNDRGNRRGGNSNRRGRGRGRGGFADRPSDRFLKEEAIPTADFDFASSNAKFSKVDLVKEFGQLSVGEDTPPARAPQQQPQHQPDEFYSKTKGFFDDISCDAKERYEQQQEGKLSLNERRARLQHERKTNMETFGKSSAEGASYRGGARGRPYRGRGGNGGQQRGGNNNTNNNTNNGRPVSPQNGGNYNGGGGRGGYGRGNRRGGRPPR